MSTEQTQDMIKTLEEVLHDLHIKERQVTKEIRDIEADFKEQTREATREPHDRLNKIRGKISDTRHKLKELRE